MKFSDRERQLLLSGLDRLRVEAEKDLKKAKKSVAATPREVKWIEEYQEEIEKLDKKIGEL